MSIRVNVSDRAAASESRDIEPVPSGKYLVIVTDAEVREVKEGANAGKPMMALEFTIEEPEEYAGRKMWTNVMLWGDAFSAVWICKALGIYNGHGDLNFPEAPELMGEKFVVRAVKVGETADKNDPQKIYPSKNEIKGYQAASIWGSRTTAATTPASLLP